MSPGANVGFFQFGNNNKLWYLKDKMLSSFRENMTVTTTECLSAQACRPALAPGSYISHSHHWFSLSFNSETGLEVYI